MGGVTFGDVLIVGIAVVAIVGTWLLQRYERKDDGRKR